ncbi:MAG: hypothetical protein WCS42_13360, partial [Verrucomicrobiota bacterium]
MPFIAAFAITADRLLGTSAARLRTTATAAVLRTATLRRARLWGARLRGRMLGPRLATGLSALRPALLTSALLLMARTIFDYVGNDLG